MLHVWLKLAGDSRSAIPKTDGICYAWKSCAGISRINKIIFNLGLNKLRKMMIVLRLINTQKCILLLYYYKYWNIFSHKIFELIISRPTWYALHIIIIPKAYFGNPEMPFVGNKRIT